MRRTYNSQLNDALHDYKVKNQISTILHSFEDQVMSTIEDMDDPDRRYVSVPGMYSLTKTTTDPDTGEVYENEQDKIDLLNESLPVVLAKLGTILYD